MGNQTSPIMKRKVLQEPSPAINPSRQNFGIKLIAMARRKGKLRCSNTPVMVVALAPWAITCLDFAQKQIPGSSEVQETQALAPTPVFLTRVGEGTTENFRGAFQAAPRGPDLGFLSAEEARAIFHVLQRDAELRRAERDRVRRLLKRKTSETGLQGVTGEWFEEIQRKKFQNNTDVNRLLKQPLEHQLRKSKKANHKEFKMSSHASPAAQKNTSASFLGFRSPFAWLFSFRKSRKQQTLKEPRYDCSASTSPKGEEMAAAETYNPPTSTEPSCHPFEANQDELVEKTTQEWNEQLEKEFFRVLDDLDDQLAQEQARDPSDRAVAPGNAASRQCSPVSGASEPLPGAAARGQRRARWSHLPAAPVPDGLRTIRAKDEHKVFIRPRKLQSAYINWHQAAFKEDYKYDDPFDGNPHLLSSRLPSISYGQSSEGSLYPPSIAHNSGFRHQHYMNRDPAGRSYSVCSLRRCPSAVSSEQLSAAALQHPLARESGDGFVPRFGRQNPKRIPLSSIVWNNAPDSAAQASAQEKMFRTQSLLEFHAAEHGRYPSPLQESRKYACYHSKHHYRRSLSSSNCFSRVSCPDKAASPLSFDNWENYPLYKSDNNLSRSCYWDASSHGKLYINQKKSPYGKKDNYPFWAEIPPYHSDKVFTSPDASLEVVVANLADHQWAHAKSAKYATQRLQSDFHVCSPDHTSIRKITRSVSTRTCSEFSESGQPWPSWSSPVAPCFTRCDEPVFPDARDQSQPLGQSSRSGLASQRSSEMDSEQLDGVEDKNLLDEVAVEDMTLLSVSQQADTNCTNTPSFPCGNSASALLPNTSSLFNPLRSKGQPQVTVRREAVKPDTSNSNKRNVQMRGDDLSASRGFNQQPWVLPADESRRESFLPSQRPWEQNLCYATENIKVDNQRAEIVNQAAAKGEASLMGVDSAPSTAKLVSHPGMVLSPECSSGSSQSSSQAPSLKDNLKCSETPTYSPGICTVTESQAAGGKATQVSRAGATQKISQATSQSPSTLVTKECSRQFTPSPHHESSASIYTHSFGDPKTSEHSLNYICLEKENRNIRNNSPSIERRNKQDSSLRCSSSCSTTGSPSRSNSRSSDPLVIYYTLPRKSASVAGSIMSDTAISFPREGRTSSQECLRMEVPHRTDAFCSTQRSFSCSDTKHSLRPVPLNAASGVQGKDYPFTRSPSDSVSSSTSVGLADSCNDPSRGGYSGFSDCKEKGNCLQKYKTTSTFTVCVDEDHVKYHELVSIYYTLPRRHSRTFCNLFRDNPEDTELPLPKTHSQSPRIHNKKNEGRVSLANVFFPNALEKELPSHSSDQEPSAVVTPQNLEAAADGEDRSSPLPPGSGKGCAPQIASTARVSTDISPVLPLAKRALPDTRTADISFGDPQPAAAVGSSGKGLSGASSNRSTEKCPKERGIVQRAPPSVSTLPTPPKPDAPAEDLSSSTLVSKKNVQKGSPENCSQPSKANTNKTQNSLLLRTRVKSSLGRTSTSNVSGPPAPGRYRDNTEVKQRENLHQVTPLYSNKCSGLPLRAASSRNSRNDLISCSKKLPESQSKVSAADAASTAKPSLQLGKMGSRGAGESQNSRIKSTQNVQESEVGEDYSGLQESQRGSEGGLDVDRKDRALGVTRDQKVTQSAENESRLLSGCARDKVKDIEKRKNRPSIKNKLAAVYKTSRKFSSKNLPPKPHISNIFSQNDGGAASVEAELPLEALQSSAGGSHSVLQSANENQNPGPDPEGNTAMPRTAEGNRNDNDPAFLASNTNWRSVTSSYTQKEAISPPKNTGKLENRPSLSGQALFPDKRATRNKNVQTLGLGLEKRSPSLSPRAAKRDTVDDEGRGASRSSPPSPPLTDKNSNPFINSNLRADLAPKQSLTSQLAFGQPQSQSKSLKNANLPSEQPRKSQARTPRERHVSESARAPRGLLPRHGKRLKSHSELLSRDENENWASEDVRTRSARNLLYPSIEFGIFGKEQQLAFLENIKRSLTEGRLWRPCLLNNPGSLRDRESPSRSRSELWSSSSAGSKMSSAPSSPRESAEVCGAERAAYSDSDTDTTTDDEYYLDETDKESEL
ncbi:exophilin-5 [Nothoprocta perdicaria]|uniref:exophilin-5 n=1 Tax=Nothoprocta perdicaria TaxID=30464 RepID=UPI000E1BCD22|nr:exophilin-5 [Nothoprocta perdicaria]